MTIEKRENMDSVRVVVLFFLADGSHDVSVNATNALGHSFSSNSILFQLFVTQMHGVRRHEHVFVPLHIYLSNILMLERSALLQHDCSRARELRAFNIVQHLNSEHKQKSCIFTVFTLYRWLMLVFMYHW